MTSKLKSIFSKGSKSTPDSDPKPRYSKLESSSNSLYSVQTTQTTNVSEEKRNAWEAKRIKAAEDYLYKNGYGMIFPPIRV
ncbi:hypothetical protein SLS53_007469 [Cytospora paraplurivora]|uniref:Uncharacterized protein n=1 Tax=Cytospora paraplurivora TaxID=2898453 RepID=A0AAN9U311_9PEZI